MSKANDGTTDSSVSYTPVAPLNKEEQRLRKKIIRLMFPETPGHPYHGFMPPNQERIDKMLALINSQVREAYKAKRIEFYGLQ